MDFLNEILSNQLVAGLSAATILGGVMYQLREAPKRIYALFIYLCTAELVVQNNDPSFAWLESWLAAQPYAARTRRVRLTSEDMCSLDQPAEWRLSPGHGLHWFAWRNRLVFISRMTEQPSPGAVGSTKRFETLEFRTLGRSQSILRSLVGDAQAAMVESNLIRIRVWRGYWANIRGKVPRELRTIILSAGQKDRIVADMTRYLGARSWYVDRGIPYRRGYLFDGAPGTGKTSLVLALAGHFNLPVCLINLGALQSDDSLMAAIIDAPANSIIVLEDVDCASSAKSRAPRLIGPQEPAPENKEVADDAGVTKAGLLNALDGIATPDGRIFIMTTNFPERLDAALLRPGRADVRETFSYLDADGQQELASLFYGPDVFRPVGVPVSPAVLQSAFMRAPDDPEKARAIILREAVPHIEAVG